MAGPDSFLLKAQRLKKKCTIVEIRVENALNQIRTTNDDCYLNKRSFDWPAFPLLPLKTGQTKLRSKALCGHALNARPQPRSTPPPLSAPACSVSAPASGRAFSALMTTKSAWDKGAKPTPKCRRSFGSAALGRPSHTMRLQNVRKARAFLKMKRGNPAVSDLTEQGRRRLFQYLSKSSAHAPASRLCNPLQSSFFRVI